jgi:hypothetical protein
MTGARLPWYRRPLRWWGVVLTLAGFALAMWLVEPYGGVICGVLCVAQHCWTSWRLRRRRETEGPS